MFSLQLRKIFTSRLVRPLALLAIAALSAPGTATASDWKAVGSTGTVDNTCYFSTQMDGFEAKLLFPGLLFSCKLRYQVTDTFAGAPPTKVAIHAHIRDLNTVPGKVVVRLFEYPKTGTVTLPLVPIAQIDSDTTPSSGNVGTGLTLYKSKSGVVPCTPAPPLDFSNNSYWIEVELTPGVFPALPGIAFLQLTQCT